MSYDISLTDPVTVTGETLHTHKEHNMTGGTYQLGGTTELWLNVTYNYSKFYYNIMGENGIRTIYGMSGAESIPILKNAADQLSDEINPDYWKPTEGNAKQALLKLIAMAHMRPDGVWGGD